MVLIDSIDSLGNIYDYNPSVTSPKTNFVLQAV